MNFKKSKSFLLSLMIFGLPFAFHPTMSASLAQSTPVISEVSQSELLSDQDIQKIESLLTTIKQRITLMDEISAAKWNAGKGILEIESEKAQLETIAQEAKMVGMDDQVAQEIFAKQFEAAQIAQINEFERLVQIQAGQVPTHLSNPQAALDDLNEQLFFCMKEALPALKKQGADKILKVKIEIIFADVDPEVASTALAPFTTH